MISEVVSVDEKAEAGNGEERPFAPRPAMYTFLLPVVPRNHFCGKWKKIEFCDRH